ncbi:MAG: ATP-binding protein [Coriobacteriia bacterium]|nr:ATP-binding protein [Coriobacteriia bacterium]
MSSVSGDQYVKVEENLGDGFVRLKISEAERRQAKHDIRTFEDIVVELLRNSRDAHARRLYIANSREGDVRTLTVIDDGVGVPASMQERVFEPRVTSKLETMVMDRWGVHGRGMALFSVRSNVVEARIASSDSHKGCALLIVSDTTALPEKADQSKWPTVEMDEETRRLKVGTGPHNVIRKVVEFAVEHPEMDVYLGTPTEVLASLFAHARGCLDARQLLFCDEPSKLPVWQRPAIAGDAAELVRIAAEIGVPISERTAHRVLGGEIAATDSVLDQVSPAKDELEAVKRPDIYKDRRGLRLHHGDIREFRARLEDAFDLLAERYYLHLSGEPKVTVGRDSIVVRFPVGKDD